FFFFAQHRNGLAGLTWDRAGMTKWERAKAEAREKHLPEPRLEDMPGEATLSVEDFTGWLKDNKLETLAIRIAEEGIGHPYPTTLPWCEKLGTGGAPGRYHAWLFQTESMPLLDAL